MMCPILNENLSFSESYLLNISLNLPQMFFQATMTPDFLKNICVASIILIKFFASEPALFVGVKLVGSWNILKRVKQWVDAKQRRGVASTRFSAK